MQKDRLLSLFELLNFRQYIENLTEVNASINGLDVEEVKKSVGIDNLLAEVAASREGYFTDEELDALINFYTSPVGQSCMYKAPKFYEDNEEAIDNYVRNKLIQYIDGRQKNSDNNPN